MSDDQPIEGRHGVARVEAFSDGVLAIVITIMVLELHAPEGPLLDLLWHLWPVFLAYILSYFYIAIYWVNHHRLFSYARAVTNQLLWSNIVLLLTLSLIPFTTAYLGKNHFSRDASVLYLVSLLLPALAYYWLEQSIRQTGRNTAEAQTYFTANVRKGYASIAIYSTGVLACFLSPWLGIACAAFNALLWILPWGPLDRLFLRGEK
jgi:uncharacterized membrane protein